MYIYDRKNWPKFSWDTVKVAALLAEVRFLQGRLLGYMQSLGFELQKNATLQSLMIEVIKTSEIEGEKLDKEQVRSSLARKLGISFAGTLNTDRHVEGIVAMMLDATQNYASVLTQKRLITWHRSLFPNGGSNFSRITVGKWRGKKSGIMQVVSDPIGREKIHFEAPPYLRLSKEMARFIEWINSPSKIDLVIKSAIAHFWFVTIHPFDDGNGRIARAIADMLLARSEKTQYRFYSMSAQIQLERNDYYEILEKCQKATLDITTWLEWYLHCLKRALLASNEIVGVVIQKAQFWSKYAGSSFNDRQRRVINLLLDGFYGKLTSSKWAKLSKCSQDTALRDINELIERQILVKEDAGGRSTNYKLVQIDDQTLES